MFKLYKDYKKYKKVADKVYKVAGIVAAYKYVKYTAYRHSDDNWIPSGISSSFVWYDTPEGWDYWNNLDDKIARLK